MPPGRPQDYKVFGKKSSGLKAAAKKKSEMKKRPKRMMGRR